ncbi:MAG: tetratricopeptide repeat protein [Gammaproteobacteria bacterium]|jgi:Tfp pilus assembly protein PilF
MIENLEKMLAQGQDNALLRYTLGAEYLKQGDAERATVHLRAALEHDPDYSAAWKLLGKAYSEAGERETAMEAYRKGIEIAGRRGDKQAEKEMQVFLRRLEKSAS